MYPVAVAVNRDRSRIHPFAVAYPCDLGFYRCSYGMSGL